MNLPRIGLRHRVSVLAFTLALLGLGLYNLSTMPRREDPEVTLRGALVVTEWPGASASRVEALITDPLEAAIGEIADIEKFKSRSYAGLSVMEVIGLDHVVDSDQFRDKIRAKIRGVQDKLPNGVRPPVVDDEFGDVFEIHLALYQVPPDGSTSIARPYTPRELEGFAEQITDELRLLESVALAKTWGLQGERIFVEVDSADWAKLEIGTAELKQAFQARNIVIPGGEIHTNRTRNSVAPTGVFTRLADIEGLVIERRPGEPPVRLVDLPLKVDRRYAEPARALTRYSDLERRHAPSLVIGISMKSGQNVIALGKRVEEVLADLKATRLPPDIRLTRVNDLPRQVETRISEFRWNLAQGVVLVLAIALLATGWRAALVMASALPLSMLGSLAVVRYFGVELEQFAIASLIIAIGLVVDNAIVVSDNTIRLMRDGRPLREACIEGANRLALPLLAATATTIFAFLPMATIEGDVGEYTASLPIVVTATLITSYLSALLVTPVLCLWLLKPPENAENGPRRTLPAKIYDAAMEWALDHKLVVSGLAVLAFAGSLTLIPVVGTQFFPNGARDQFFVKIYLPEGASITRTSELARQIESEILSLGKIDRDGQTVIRLANVSSYIGSGGPRLMLTQEPERDVPSYALLVVNTTDPDLTPGYARDLRARLSDQAGARIAVSQFVLGPPVENPISFRLSGPDHRLLRDTARQMLAVFKRTPGVQDANTDWGAIAHQVDIKVDSDAAAAAGVSNADIADSTQALLSGLPLGYFREGSRRVPIMFRTVRERRQSVADLTDIFVGGRNGKVPLASIARLEPSWQLPVIARRDQVPTVNVGSQAQEGYLANSVAASMRPALQKIVADLPAGYRLVQGGVHEETVKSSQQIGSALLIAGILIALTLIAQYGQLRNPLIILLCAPFALIGVLIGLLVTGWALGFMAMLGVLALLGIVINNAIILIDFIEERRAAGQAVREAVIESGRARIRPVLLTTFTTIGGLLPLSLFGGPLWAPMTNGMIFGLLFATPITLVLVPVMYAALARPE